MNSLFLHCREAQAAALSGDALPDGNMMQGEAEENIDHHDAINQAEDGRAALRLSGNHTEDKLAALLALCADSIAQINCSRSSSEYFLTHITSCMLPKLVRLSLSFHSLDAAVPELFDAALQQMASNLLSLSLTLTLIPADPDRVFAAIASCKLLQNLSLFCKNAAAAHFLRLLGQCQQLTTLQAGGANLTGSDWQSILQAAGPCFKKLTASSSTEPAVGSYVVTDLIEIIEQFPSLDCVQLNYYSYCRDRKQLVLQPLPHEQPVVMEQKDMQRIFRACPALHMLAFELSLVAPDAIEAIILRIGDLYGAALRDLDLTEGEQITMASAVSKLLECCPQLTAVAIHSACAPTAFILHAIATNCRLLKYLSLMEPCSSQDPAAIMPLDESTVAAAPLSITDADMEELFTSCRHLQYVAVDRAAGITNRTLQAIAANKLKLRELTCDASVGFDEEDTASCLKELKEQGLVPLPSIVILGQRFD